MFVLSIEPPSLAKQGDQVQRTHLPTRALNLLEHTTAASGSWLNPQVHKLAEVADVLVVCQAIDADFAALFKRRTAREQITIFEINDDFEAALPNSAAAQFYTSPFVRAQLYHLASMADGLQFSTHALAQKFSLLNKNSHVFANALPKLLHKKAHVGHDSRRVTLGWAGSGGHANDLAWAMPALQEFLQGRPDVFFAAMAPKALWPHFSALPNTQVSLKEPQDYEGYLEFLQGLDIGIIPLLDTAFNRGRSDVKFLEYTSAGTAAVITRCVAYQALPHRPEVALFFDDPKSMKHHLGQLVSDRYAREHLVNTARAWVEQHRLVGPSAVARRAWYRQLLANKRASKVAQTNHTPSVRLRNAPICTGVLQAEPSERLLVQGLMHLQQQRVEEAKKLFLTAQRLTPNFYVSALYCARVASFNEAIVWLNKASTLGGHRASITLVSCEVLAAQDKHKEALALCASHLLYDDTAAHVAERASQIARAQGDVAACCGWLLQVSLLNPWHLDARLTLFCRLIEDAPPYPVCDVARHTTLVTLLPGLKSNPDALADQFFVQHAPSIGPLMLARGRYYLWLGQYQVARAALERARDDVLMRQDSQAVSQVLALLAQAQAKLGDVQAARRALVALRQVTQNATTQKRHASR